MRLGTEYPRHLAAYAGVLTLFGEGFATGAGRFWYVRCPAHEDNTPSLAFWLGGGGQLVFCCHAGCPKPDILRAMNLKWGDVMPGKEDRPRRRLLATYDYRDEKGTLLYQALRYDPKDFRQRHPGPTPDTWVWNLEGVRRVLYRLPELLQSEGRTILVVEGEKDVETARSLGLIATTNVCGSRSLWCAEYSEFLSGRHVVVIPDADAPGMRHATEVAGSLIVHEAASVRVSGLPGKDLTAFVTELRGNGLKTEALRLAVENTLREAPLWRPTRT